MGSSDNQLQVAAANVNISAEAEIYAVMFYHRARSVSIPTDDLPWRHQEYG